MIISASFRTDIPAFYGKWFRNRLEAGYCMVKNPYDGHFHRVSLKRQHTDGFFFWTKNLTPFFPTLHQLYSNRFPFVVHYSITGYPRSLEPSVLYYENSVAHMKTMAKDFGPKIGVWRYDPIVISSLTDFSFHRRNFRILAEALHGTTDEVIVSFVEIYKKTKRKMDAAAAKFGFSWENPSDAEKCDLLLELAQIAGEYGLKFSLCAQRQYLRPGINDACCIDVERLTAISGIAIAEVKPGHRGKQCGCNQSRDIGGYDSCPHGCVYCYAVSSGQQAKEFSKRHNPNAVSFSDLTTNEMNLFNRCGPRLF